MEEASFDDLHQAAVAGAEGTAWTMPEFSACYYSVFPSTVPFDSFTTHPQSSSTPSSPTSIPGPVKEEPAFLDLLAVPSSPPQQSLCSISSEESFAHASQPKKCPNPLSPSCDVKTKSKQSLPLVSKLSKQRSTLRPPSNKKGFLPNTSVSDSHLATHDLADLKGTTAARSRKMTDEERKVMLLKRRLRNRASAARSREKRSRTLVDLTTEVEQLIKKTAGLAREAKKAVEEARGLKAQNLILAKQNELLRAELKL